MAFQIESFKGYKVSCVIVLCGSNGWVHYFERASSDTRLGRSILVYIIKSQKRLLISIIKRTSNFDQIKQCASFFGF